MIRASPVLCCLLLGLASCAQPPGPRATTAGGASAFWLDLLRAEEVTAEEVLADLAAADVIYVGETHTIPHHHAVQQRLLQDLFRRGARLVLCLEQLEARDQPAITRYARQEIDFDTLAREIGWAGKWNNYEDYRPLCEFARAHGIPIRGLNAPAEVIRAVNRGGGLAQLPPAERAALPPEIVTDDPLYEQLMQRRLAVHASFPLDQLRPVFEAQVARDEAMAAEVLSARTAEPGTPRTAFVVAGAGHVHYGLGLPDRVRRRQPELQERIVLVTESGQLRLSAAEQAEHRPVTISHGDLRELGRPPGDYLRVLPLASAPRLPAGHPPVR